MKRAYLREHGKGSLELIEEAFHLLRAASLATLAAYYVGTMPFVLGLLYFWADMSRNPFAAQHLAGAALGLALLFVWMKCGQAIFARRLRAQLAAGPPPPWTLRRLGRLLVAQTLVQPTGLFLLPLAVVAVLPFAWAYAFYQNVTVLADGETQDLKAALKKSWQQSSLWPHQNHFVLAVLALFGFCVFLNWIVVCLTLPQLVGMFLGVESVFTQSPASMLNTTFFTAMAGLTYLCLDPLVKAIYVLRCFYGDSLRSGQDLKAELKQFALPAGAPVARALAVCLLLSAGIALATPAQGAEAITATTPSAPAQQIKPTVSAPELDRAIDEVIQQRKYTWRLPREKAPAKEAGEKGLIARFLERAWELLKRCVRAVRDWLLDLLDRLFRRRVRPDYERGSHWLTTLHALLFVLVAVAASALAILLYRVLRDRRCKAKAVAAEAIQPVPDLANEHVGAEQLPEDEWTRLGRQLLERGELRLALRAYYLGSLAHLAGRGLVTLARFKSNRDYERELQRRGHALPGLPSLFGECVSVFDRVWYGLHEVNAELVQQFVAHVDRIRTAG